MVLSGNTLLNGVPAMARHLTLEEREIVAQMRPRRSQTDGDRPTAGQASEHDFPRTATQSQPQRLLGGGGPERRPKRDAATAVGLQDGTARSAALCPRAAAAAMVARPDRRTFAERFSPRSAAADFAPDDLRLDSTRKTPPERTGGATCGAPAGSGRTPENRGPIAGLRRASRDVPPSWIAAARYGDWEGDTVVGADRRGGAVTLVERKSGYLLLGKVRDLQAATVRQAAARIVSHRASSLAEDVDAGQRQGVCRTRAIGGGSRVEGLLCQALLCVAARHERKHQRPGPAVLSQRHGSGQHPRASFYQSPTTSERPPPKTSRLSNSPRSSQLTTSLRLRLDAAL